MTNFLSKLIQTRTPYFAVLDRRTRRRNEADLEAWQKAGKPAPPPHLVKQRTLEELAREFGLKVLVETGTFYGDMVRAMENKFDRIFSIELSPELHQRAQRRFRKSRHVELVCGDSADELGKIVARLDVPALFWLDGHYSAGVTAKGTKNTPILEELDHIFASAVPGHVIVIDDARSFGPEPDYPTLDELEKYVRARWPDAGFIVEHDSIRITPRR